VKVVGFVSTLALTSASTKSRYDEASALCQNLRWDEAKVILNEEIDRLGQDLENPSRDTIDYLNKHVMLAVVAEDSTGDRKQAKSLLETYCPIIEEIHGFADSTTGHCYQSLLAMYGRSGEPRDFYTLLDFVRTKHEIDTHCAQHPHIPSCTSNFYKFDALRKNVLVYSSQRINSVITNYFQVSGRERKEMVRDARKLPNRFQSKYGGGDETSYPSQRVLRQEHKDATEFVDFVLKRLSEVRKMLTLGSEEDEIRSYLSSERYALSVKLEEFRNTAPSQMFFVNSHTNDMNMKYSEMRQLTSRLQALMKIQATVLTIGVESFSLDDQSVDRDDQDGINHVETNEFRPIQDSASQESKVAISVFLTAAGTIVLVLTQGGRDWIVSVVERFRNVCFSSKRQRKRSRSKRRSSSGSSNSRHRDERKKVSSTSMDLFEDDLVEEEEEEEEEKEEEMGDEEKESKEEKEPPRIVRQIVKNNNFNENDISTKGAGSPSPSPPQIKFRPVPVHNNNDKNNIKEKQEEKKKQKKKYTQKRSKSNSGNSIKPLVLPSHHQKREDKKKNLLRLDADIMEEEKNVKEIEFTFSAICNESSLEKKKKKKVEEKIKMKKKKKPKSFADVLKTHNEQQKKVRPCQSLLLAISASKFPNSFSSQYHHILCMKRSDDDDDVDDDTKNKWSINVKIPGSLRFVRYRYAFACEEDVPSSLDKDLVNLKWEVVPARHLDVENKSSTLLSAGSLEFQNIFTALPRKLIVRKLKTTSMWKKRRVSSSSSKRLRASSMEWYPVYARTPSPSTIQTFFGDQFVMMPEQSNVVWMENMTQKFYDANPIIAEKAKSDMKFDDNIRKEIELFFTKTYQD